MRQKTGSTGAPVSAASVTQVAENRYGLPRNDASAGSADITLAFFPGKYTGLREKPYYDEVLTKLLSESEKSAPAASEHRPTPK